jgi:hypothetical protein
MPPPELPPLPPGPLSLATARSLGLHDHQWRLPQLLRTTQSVRSVAEPANVQERAASFLMALPADVTFSHVTAAQLWGLPLPRGLEEQVALDVMRETSRGRIVRQGCLSHKGGERRTRTTVHGLPVTSLVDTWVDLGEVVGRGLGRDDLVVAGDVVATRTSRVPPGSPIADAVWPLEDALASRVRPRNKVLLRSALELVRPGVRSPMESRSRLMFVDAGFPEPEVNGHVHSGDGGWLAECDLLWRAQKVIGEYQGAVHSGMRARSRDSHRNGLLTDEGWLVLEIFAEDHTDPHRKALMLNRFARALDLDPATLRLAG